MSQLYTPAHLDVSRPPRVELNCPDCSVSLTREGEQLTCPSCRATYPVVDGVPRLIQQDFYWGEIDRNNAIEFVEDAKSLGWKNAVAKRFSAGSDAWISILDWQRASWIPLLTIPKNSVVLDIGSGYGALTHALAATYDEVHSLEAIPQRVEFTNLRLQQEGFKNVHLVQGSALRLPYAPQSFDAVIVNGILEWIGDWDLDGDPRSAQLRFLRRIHTLLKPGGTLLVGIENRIAYDAFAGALDHSDLPFTSLLPRSLASVALRTFAKKHHRMEQPSRSYRTFTYSEAGYRKLFREAGFASTDSYWAEPGYNQPYRLSPTDSKSVRLSLEEAQLEPIVADRVRLAGRIKRLMARFGFLRYLVPEFVFIVRGDERQRSPLQESLPVSIDKHSQFRLTTAKFASKTTIRVSSPSGPGLVLHVSTLSPGSVDAVTTEYATLERVTNRLESSRGIAKFRVPTPLGSAQVGRQRMTVQSLVPGKSVSMTLLENRPDTRVTLLETILPSLAESIRSIPAVLEGLDGLISANRWVSGARPLLDQTTAGRADAIADTFLGAAHGDLTIENTILDRDSGHGVVTLIDWESAAHGVPPLYDLFSFYLSLLPAVSVPREVAARFGDSYVAQAYSAFFHEGEWSRLLGSNLRPQVPASDAARASTLDLFLDSLIFRIGYLAERGSPLAVRYASLAAMAQQHRSEFQL